PPAPGLAPSTDVAVNVDVPASYATCQLTDRLYAGLGLNGPFGLLTKPDNTWAGSPLAITSKVFSLDINPTLAYKVTPDLTVGVGLQVEYFSITLGHGSFNSLFGPLTGSRTFDADDWSVGATAGVLWQPSAATSIGLGYRSAVGVSPSGQFATTPGILTGP